MIRIGSGHDTHRLVLGRPLILGGVTVPHTHGLDGHSDADVLLHSLTDAILGALGLGDIGDLFPDTEPQYKNADSKIFLDSALKLMKESGFEIVNVDATLFAQQPKLGPVKAAIRESVANMIDNQNVNIKAKTGERVGHIGRGEAIGCHVVILIQKTDSPQRT